KINRIGIPVLDSLDGKMVMESSHGFIMSKDLEDNIFVTADVDNIKCDTANVNYLTKCVREQDNLVMFSSGYQRYVYYDGVIYKYQGSINTYERFFISSELNGSKAEEARRYYNNERLNLLTFCQKTVAEIIERLQMPLDILTCIDYI